MQRSHSRETHKFDRLFPRETAKFLRGNRIAKRLCKKLQQRKQRQYDSRLTRQVEL